MDIDAFINLLKTLADTKVDESVTTKALISFEQNICANLFSALRNNFIQSIFMNIFNILFGLSLHETTSIKLESSRAMSIFLSRLLPFYNDLLQKSFSKVIEDLKIRTPLVPASFAFMSKHVSQPLLLQYINITPIVDQFQVNDACFPFIINNMGQLGTGFLQYLLKKLIAQLKTDPNRHLFRSIGSLIKHSPTLFLPQVLHLDYLTLFAYVFLNVEFDHSKFDLSHVSSLISTVLQSEKSSPLERDCAYQVLSTLSPKVSKNPDDENLIDVTFCDTKVTLDPQKNLDRPPFFLLPLPLDLLRPKENESVLQLSPKFKTIAKTATTENISEVLSIFREHLNLPYSEVVSSAIIGLSTQPKRLRCPELINAVLYKKSVSWFHSIDILRVIKSFEILNTHTLNLIYEFIVSGNVRLSNEAIDVVKSLTKSENSEMIENFFSQKVDFFDDNIFERMLTTLVAVSDKTSVKSYLNFLSKILLEVVDSHKDNITVLSLIFNFLSHKDLSFASAATLNQPCKIAIAVCEAYLAVIYGDIHEAEANFNNQNGQSSNNKNQNSNNKNKGQINIDFRHFLIHAKKDVLSKSFDIINETENYHEFYPRFSAAVQFVFSLPIFVIGVPKAIDLSSKIFTFFPKLCSEFYEKNWSNIDESYKNNIMQVLFMKLQFVSDHETIAIWCRIALKTQQIFKRQQITKTIQSMNFTCATLLTPNLTDMKSAADFSAYLFVSIGDQHKKSIQIFVSNLNDEQKSTFQGELNKIFENKVPSFYSEILAIQNGSPSLQKVETNNVDDVTIPINETGFVSDVNKAILGGNPYDVIALLKKGIDDNVSFNLFDFNFPSKMIEAISKWIAFSVSYESLKKMLAITEPSFSLFDYLQLARTEWRKMVIYLIESDPINADQLLSEISNSPKIKYNTILNLCSISSYVYFNSPDLFGVAARVSMSAEKVKKLNASFLFLANVLSIINRSNKNGQFKPRPSYTFSVSVPDSHFVSDLNNLLHLSSSQKSTKVDRFSVPSDFPINFVNRINGFFESLPHREASFCLSQISKNSQKVDALFLFFCRKLLLAGSKYFGGVGQLCSLIITRYDDLIQVNKTLTIDFDSIVQCLLNFSGTSDNESENSNNNNNAKKKNPEIYWSDDIISDAVTSPSMFLNAIRIVDSLKKFKNTLHPILSSYRFWHRLPFVNHRIIKSITRDVWHERFRYMKKYFDKIDQSLPEYDTVLDFAAFVLSSPELQQKNKDDEMCSRSFSIFSQTIEVPTSRKLLNTALCCLIARLNFVCVADNDKGQTMVMDALIEWLSGLDKKDGPLTLFFAFDFAKILEMKMEAQSFFALIACQYIRCAPRFFTVFPAVAKYFLKYVKCGWATEIIKSCLPFLKSECHKKAIEYLIDQNLEMALKLALFEKDCDESNDLLGKKDSNGQTGDLIDLS